MSNSEVHFEYLISRNQRRFQMKFLSAKFIPKYEISQLRASIQASAGDADDALSRTRDECGEATQAMPAVRTSARGAAPIAAACDF